MYASLSYQEIEQGRGLTLYMAKTKSKFICQSCGYESPKWMGKCPGCGA
ncbi:DNA repair protein RadA, partial [Lactobacillus delbrueckii subsp. bulgaricus]